MSKDPRGLPVAWGEWKKQPEAMCSELGYRQLGRVEFRGVQQGDIPALIELNRKLFPVVYSEQFYQDLLSPNHVSILAFVAGTDTLIGAATAVLEVDERDKKLHAVPGTCGSLQTTAYIMTLGVASGYRRRGLGATLLRRIVDECNADRFTLHMKIGNEDALRMYLQFGFQVTEKLLNHYNINGHSYDALLLVYSPPSFVVGAVESALTWLGLTACFKNSSLLHAR